MQALSSADADKNALRVEDRRALLIAAKRLTQFRLNAVCTNYGIATSNFRSFLSGRDVALKDTKQFIVLKNYGFGSQGQLLEFVHSWVIEEIGDFKLVKKCLAYEIGINSVNVFECLFGNDGEILVGFFVEFNSLMSPKKRRVIITVNDLSIGREIAFKRLSEVMQELGVVVEAVVAKKRYGAAMVREIFRWSGSRKSSGSVIPKEAHLSYNLDINSPRESGDSTILLLQQMVERFDSMSKELALMRGAKQSTWDLSYVKRARKHIEGMI